MHNSIIESVVVAGNGTLQVRIALQKIEAGEIVETKWHRTAIEPGGDVDAQMAVVNQHLSKMGQAEVADMKHLKNVAKTEHTAARIASHREWARLNSITE